MNGLDACIAKYTSYPYFKSFSEMVGCVVELVDNANSAILEDQAGAYIDVIRDKLIATNTKLPILGEYDKNQNTSFIQSAFPENRLCKEDDGDIYITPVSGVQWVSWEKFGTEWSEDQPKSRKANLYAFISEDRAW
jgi:hypothetical protein